MAIRLRDELRIAAGDWLQVQPRIPASLARNDRVFGLGRIVREIRDLLAVR